MPKNRQCRGCGAYLQSEQESLAGYLPQHLWADDGVALVCQRCYRITHYGQEQHSNTTTGDQAISLVKTGVEWGDCMLLVLDLMDFEASLPQALSDMIRGKPVIALVNKVDLLPPKTSVAEAYKWVTKKLRSQGLHYHVFLVSGMTGFGITELLEYITNQKYQRITVVGATNAGKSTLIGKILSSRNQKGGGLPTVAKFPGTTVRSLQWKLSNKITLADTPGLVPPGRLSDKVCPTCAGKLIPGKKISIKLYELSAKSGIVIPGLAAIQMMDSNDLRPVFLGFSASDISWQRASLAKIASWLEKSLCDCHWHQWKTHQVHIPMNFDLIIHGLGWVSVRKMAVDCQLTIPDGVAFDIRPNLVGPKKND